jgi:Tol biopolymer transport system component
MVDVYLSYHQADEKYQKAVEKIIREMNISGLGTIHTYQDYDPRENWRETNARISNSIVVFLVTKSWYVECQYEMRVTLHHQRPFIVLYCYSVAAPDNYPEKLRQVLNSRNPVNLFKDDKLTIDEEEYTQLQNTLKEHVANSALLASNKRPLAAKPLYNRIEELATQWNKLRGLVFTLGGIVGLLIIAFLSIRVLMSGGEVVIPDIELPVATQHPLPEATTLWNEEGYLTFHVGVGSILNISLFDLMTGAETPVTNTEFDTANPAWSCDGQRIAYTSNRSGNFEIYIYNVASRREQRITTTPNVAEGYVSWSPDGTELVYSARPDSELVAESWVLPRIVGNATSLSHSETDLELFILNLASRKSYRITYNGAGDRVADWSCTTNKIVFESGVGDAAGRIDIYVHDPSRTYHYANGTGENLTDHTDVRTRFPAWSCDGQRIAYHASPDRDEDAEIYVMDRNGSNVQQITNNSYNDFGPVWSPDGQHLVFHANGRGSNYDLYIINLTTRNIQRLTATPDVGEAYAMWQPQAGCS